MSDGTPAGEQPVRREGLISHAQHADAPHDAGGGAAALVDLAQDPALSAKRMEVPAGTALYEPDAPAQHVFALHEGQVRTLKLGEGSARLLEILGPGDWFGAPALSGSGTYGTRALAVSSAVVSEIPAAALLAVLPQHPRVARGLIMDLASKLQAAHEAAANLVFEDTNSRLVRTLLQFSRTAAASRTEGAPEVVLRITHQQLAQAVGAARETVSLALTQLRHRNLLRTGRNKLSFDPTVLEQFARRSAGQGEAKGSEAER